MLTIVSKVENPKAIRAFWRKDFAYKRPTSICNRQQTKYIKVCSDQINSYLGTLPTENLMIANQRLMIANQRAAFENSSLIKEFILNFVATG